MENLLNSNSSIEIDITKHVPQGHIREDLGNLQL